MAYDPTNSGAIYRNDRKQQPNHPDFQGQCNVDGKEWWISMWSKEAGPQAKNPGSRFFSLSFKPKDAARAPAPATQARDDDMAPTPIAGGKPATPQSPYETPEKPAAKATPATDELDSIPF